MHMGATFPRWGPRFKLFSDGGYDPADGGGIPNCFADGGYGSLFTPRWGLRSKFFSDGGYGSADGGGVPKCFAHGGYGFLFTKLPNLNHGQDTRAEITQMGASFLVMQIVSTSIRSASSKYMQVDSFETDYSYEVFRS